MADDAWQDPTKGPSEQEVAIDYIKADGFRTIWVDGAVGGATPRGLIHCALYAERPAIPRRQVFGTKQIDEATLALTREIHDKRISRASIVREMACDIFLTPEAAENLGNWLLERVNEHRQMHEDSR